MESNNHAYEDTMRAFFKFHVDSLGSLLPAIMEIVKRPSADDSQALLINLSQANNIVLVSNFARFH